MDITHMTAAYGLLAIVLFVIVYLLCRKPTEDTAKEIKLSELKREVFKQTTNRDKLESEIAELKTSKAELLKGKSEAMEENQAKADELLAEAEARAEEMLIAANSKVQSIVQKALNEAKETETACKTAENEAQAQALEIIANAKAQAEQVKAAADNYAKAKKEAADTFANTIREMALETNATVTFK